MSEHDIVDDVIERLEWEDDKREQTPQSRLWKFTRRSALTGGAAGLTALALEACGASASGGGNASSVFGSSKKLRFTFVNHVTTNVFFTPTQYGAADACRILGCSYQWTGSESSNVNEMVNALNTAVTGAVDGIAVSLIDPKAFNQPVSAALSAGIPVVAYNADVPGNARLAYIGQDLLKAGQMMGQHINSLVPSGSVALFIATPGSANIQPRINGALQVIRSSGGATPHVIATGAAQPGELTAIDAYWVGHQGSTKGMFAVDGGSTQATGQVMQKYGLHAKGIKAGGFDLAPITQQRLASGDLDFTIDQQPYLQGFLPVLELYLYKVSQTLSGIADVDTGLKFLTQSTIKPYVSTKTRYEGTSTSGGVH